MSRQSQPTYWILLLGVSVALVLSACGGGGDTEPPDMEMESVSSLADVEADVADDEAADDEASRDDAAGEPALATAVGETQAQSATDAPTRDQPEPTETEPAPPSPTRPPPTEPLPTEPPPTEPSPTEPAPPTEPPPTAPPAPTEPPQLESGALRITTVNYDGVNGRSEPDEYVEFVNDGGPVNLQGWSLRDTDGNVFSFPSFEMAIGQTCRVYTNEHHPESCGFSFGNSSAIWGNSGDTAILMSPSGGEVSRWGW